MKMNCVTEWLRKTVNNKQKISISYFNQKYEILSTCVKINKNTTGNKELSIPAPTPKLKKKLWWPKEKCNFVYW